MLDKIFERLKINSAQTNLVRKAGLTMPERLSLGTLCNEPKTRRKNTLYACVYAYA